MLMVSMEGEAVCAERVRVDEDVSTLMNGFSQGRFYGTTWADGGSAVTHDLLYIPLGIDEMDSRFQTQELPAVTFSFPLQHY